MLSKIKRFLKKSEINVVKASSLFDANWYASEYEIKLPKKELLSHYLVEGHLQGFDPSPEFNGEAYRRVYMNSRDNPLVHYLNLGRFLGYLKVSSSRCTSDNDIIVGVSKGLNKSPIVKLLKQSSGFFADWYANNYGLSEEIKHLAVYHFLIFGAEEGCDPNPYFSTSDYLVNNPDVAKEMVNPFFHYIKFGWQEGRKVSRSSNFEFNNESLDSEVRVRQEEIDSILFGGNFDLAWFNRVYDLRYETPSYAILHYLVGNYNYSLDPVYSFNTLSYVSQHDDVKRSRMNPYLHYIRYGKSEQRKVQLSQKAKESHINEYLRSIKLSLKQKTELELLGRSRYFCYEFYSRLYQKLGLEKSQCAKHYYLFGGFEGKDPSELFSSSFYLAAHSDVLQSGMNPLVHFLISQNTEKRAFSHSKSAKTDLLGDIVTSKASNQKSCFPSLSPSAFMAVEKEMEKKAKFTTTGKGSLKAISDLEWTTANASLVKQYFPALQCKKIVADELVSKLERPKLKLLQNRSQKQLRVGLELVKEQEIVLILLQKKLTPQKEETYFIDNLAVTSQGAIYADLWLENPFAAVAVLLVNSNQVVDVVSVPFPSLLDGGVHSMELAYYSSSREPTVEEFQRLCKKFEKAASERQSNEPRIWNVELRNARGFEPIFNGEFKAWLKEYWNVSVATSSSASINQELHATLDICSADVPQYLSGEIPSIHYLSKLVNDEMIKSHQVLCRSTVEPNLSERYLRRSVAINRLPCLEQEISALSVDAAPIHVNNVLGAANMVDCDITAGQPKVHLVINYKSIQHKDLSITLQMLKRQKGIIVDSLNLIIGAEQKLDFNKFEGFDDIDITLFRRREGISYHTVLEKVFRAIGEGYTVLLSEKVYLYNALTLRSLVGELDNETKVVTPLLFETKNVKGRERLAERSIAYHIFSSQAGDGYSIGSLNSSLAPNQNSFVEAATPPLLVVDTKAGLVSVNLLNKGVSSEFINNDAQSLFLLSYAASFSGYSVVSANRFVVGCNSLRLDTIESQWAEEVLPAVTKEWKEK